MRGCGACELHGDSRSFSHRDGNSSGLHRHSRGCGGRSTSASTRRKRTSDRRSRRSTHGDRCPPISHLHHTPCNTHPRIKGRNNPSENWQNSNTYEARVSDEGSDVNADICEGGREVVVLRSSCLGGGFGRGWWEWWRRGDGRGVEDVCPGAVLILRRRHFGMVGGGK